MGLLMEDIAILMMTSILNGENILGMMAGMTIGIMTVHSLGTLVVQEHQAKLKLMSRLLLLVELEQVRKQDPRT